MGGRIESYVLELVSLPTLGIASTVLVEGYLCGILRTIQKKCYEEKFCCRRSRMDNLRREPLPWYHQCLKTLHFLIYVDTSLPKLAELAEQYFAFRPCSLFKEAMALKWSLVKRKNKKTKKNGLKTGEICSLQMESAISGLFFLILQLLGRRISFFTPRNLLWMGSLYRCCYVTTS